jgi:hypothetical protein
VIALAGFLVAGCGDDEDATPTDTGTVTAPVETTTVKAYWLLDGKVWPVHRDVEDSDAVGAALGELLTGPTAQEETDLEMSTAIPTDTVGGELEVTDGVASVKLSSELSNEALAQVVYTLTQFPMVESAEINGETYTRADFEDQTPAILVESPLAFEEVTSPVRATGTANTFEATFQYELTDTDGRIVDEDFVTATSGTGTRGTFELTTDDFTVPFDGIGALIVYELSAKDGTTRLHLVEIPLKMSD